MDYKFLIMLLIFILGETFYIGIYFIDDFSISNDIIMLLSFFLKLIKSLVWIKSFKLIFFVS